MECDALCLRHVEEHRRASASNATSDDFRASDIHDSINGPEPSLQWYQVGAIPVARPHEINVGTKRFDCVHDTLGSVVGVQAGLAADVSAAVDNRAVEDAAQTWPRPWPGSAARTARRLGNAAALPW
eukprot:scaffold61642_cov87-Phaeocystis_antarctica.AAC.5